jgi:transposase
VFELPPVEPVVTEYQQHTLGCGLCGHRTMGKLPEGASTRAFGPTVDAVIAVLMGVYRLTKRQVPELMRDLFSLQMSVGAVVECQQSASAAIAEQASSSRRTTRATSLLRGTARGTARGARATRWCASPS